MNGEVKGFFVDHGPFFGDSEGVLACSQSKKRLEDWLKLNGWVKSREKWNKGLWEKEFAAGNWYWATIQGTTLITVD
jgi:hypothetical protein